MNTVEQIIDFNKNILAIAQGPEMLAGPKEHNFSMECLQEEFDEYKEACEAEDIVTMLDALFDLMFFGVGVMYRAGMNEATIGLTVCGGLWIDTHSLYTAIEDRKGLHFRQRVDIDFECPEFIESIEEDLRAIEAAYDLKSNVAYMTNVAVLLNSVMVRLDAIGLSRKQCEDIMTAIYEANMTKKRGSNAKRGDGQVADAVKPTDFIPPEDKIAYIIGLE